MRAALNELVRTIREMYPGENPVPLHAPRFRGNEKRYLAECIDSTFVSYVGEFVTRFEEQIRVLTGIKHAVAMVNGTAAIQMGLVAAGLRPGDHIITQALTFAATANAIRHAGGDPVFVDVDEDTMGLSPVALRSFLEERTQRIGGEVVLKDTGRRVFACMPMHTFGFPVHLTEILAICQEWGIHLVEDSAESLGSWYADRHTGSFGLFGVLSFNGNKPVTTGGGGMMLTNDDNLAARARHISTTAKRKHPYEFFHDELGWNMRMPNVNAAVGVAQMETLESTLVNKRETANRYQTWCRERDIRFFHEPAGTKANYWLNAIVLDDTLERDEFLEFSNRMGVQTRPIWVLMNKLPMYRSSPRGPLDQSQWFEDRVVNLPSSYRP